MTEAKDFISLSGPSALQGFLEAAPDAILVVDAEGVVIVSNALAERMFGYARGALVGHSVEALIPERFRETHVAHRRGFLVNPRTRPMGSASMSLTGRRRDGTEFPVEISLSPMKAEHGWLVMAAVRDITERKVIEDKLRNSLREKELLLKEVHHRVKNNLQIVSSMLNLQMEQIRDAGTLALFRESQARVRSIALFHEKLYQSRDLARVDIAGYLKGLTTGLFSAYGVGPEDIALSVEADDVPLDIDAAISCGLIVNELVSNSLKHGFPDGRKGAVHVALRREGSAVLLEVSDDGVGVPEGVDVRSAGTLGLKLVSILADQLRGRMTLERGAGTRFAVRFEPGEPA
jgi:PAS domain S-box-containing protein